MGLVKKIVYLLILLLFLEVVKRIIGNLDLDVSTFTSTIIGCIQLLALLFFLFYIILRRKKTSVIFLSFFLLIACGEVLFGWWLHHPESSPRFLRRAFEYYYYNFDLDVSSYHRRFSIYDPRLFYTLKPGVNGRFETMQFSVNVSANSFGLRDDDSSLHKPSIICLGDSYTFGWGVEEQDCFAKQLEKLSGEKVLNAGISSYGTAREMTLLSQLDTSALKTIVVQYCWNDYHENDEFIQNNYQLKVSPRAVFDSVLTRKRYTSNYFPGKYFTVPLKFLSRRIADSDTTNYMLSEKLHVRLFMDILNHSTINFEKVKVIVCVAGNNNAFGSEFLREVKSISHHPNITVIDMSGILEEKDWFTLDRHFKASGHSKMAQKIWEAIRLEDY